MEVFTMDCDYGLGGVRRGKPQDMPGYTAEDIKKLAYTDLDQNRERFLNLKQPAYLHDFLKALRVA